MTEWARLLRILRYPVVQGSGLHYDEDGDGNEDEDEDEDEDDAVLAPVPRPLSHSDVLAPHEDHAGIPWSQLLSAGESVGKLSLAKTEHEFLQSLTSTGLSIHRRWDADSFIARVTDFHAYRSGFKLFYIASFLLHETQSQHLKLDGGCEIHLCKNLCLGFGVLAEGSFRTFVVFRHMSTGKTGTHLTEEEQEFWIDEIILPVIRQTYESDIIQHLPHSYAAAKRKAYVKQEKHLSGAQHPINLYAILPDDGLRQFSVNLQEHIRAGIQRAPEQFRPYQDPLFVVAGHDLKLKFKRATIAEQRITFLQFLQICFRFRPEYFPEEDCWVDLGIEDTPTAGSCSSSVVLLRKPACLTTWADQFRTPTGPRSGGQRAGITMVTYPWHLTRDAGSAEVKLAAYNPLREYGGLTFHKAYNVHKVLYDTPIKGHQLFALPLLHGLAYSQELLREWAEASRLGSSTMKKFDRVLLVKTFETVKARLRTALSDHARGMWGIRQEYRIQVRVYRGLESADDRYVELAHAAQAEGEHRPYWILPARAVGAFVTAEMNRWLLGIEFLISRADAAAVSVGSLRIGREAQLLNGAMLTVLLRTVRISLAGENPSRHLSLCRKEYPGRRRVVDPAQESGSYWIDTGMNRLGLAYHESIAANGVPGLPDALVNWESLSFRPDKLAHMVFSYHRLGAPSGQAAAVHEVIVRETHLMRLLRADLEPLPATKSTPGWGDAQELEQALTTMTQLIIKQYIRDILQKVVLKRAVDDLSHTDPQIRRASARIADRLSDLDSYDLAGFSYQRISSLLGFPPHVITPKLPSANGTTRSGARPHFRDYNGHQWRDWPGKLQGLFEWDDDRDPQKRRGWHDYPFRLLTRRFYAVVLEKRGREVADRFRAQLGYVAARHLWLIPNYDHEHIAVLRKPYAHNAAATRQEIETASTTARTSWVIASIKAGTDLADRLAAINRHFSHGERVPNERLDRDNLAETQEEIQRAVYKGRLTIWQPVRSTDAFTRSGLTHADHYGIDLSLTDADEISARFPDAVAQSIELDDAESDDAETQAEE